VSEDGWPSCALCGGGEGCYIVSVSRGSGEGGVLYACPGCVGTRSLADVLAAANARNEAREFADAVAELTRHPDKCRERVNSGKPCPYWAKHSDGLCGMHHDRAARA